MCDVDSVLTRSVWEKAGDCSRGRGGWNGGAQRAPFPRRRQPTRPDVLYDSTHLAEQLKAVFGDAFCGCVVSSIGCAFREFSGGCHFTILMFLGLGSFRCPDGVDTSVNSASMG